MKKLIVITGCLASGKSFFYEMIKNQFNIIGINKDELKIEIGCESEETIEGQYALGNMAFERLMDELERGMERGVDLVVEGAFSNTSTKRKINEQIKIKEKAQKYGYSLLAFNVVGDLGVLYQRFVEREKNVERNPILRMDTEKYGYRLHSLFNENLRICLFDENVIKIDTTDFSKVDYLSYLEVVNRFINDELNESLNKRGEKVNEPTNIRC